MPTVPAMPNFPQGAESASPMTTPAPENLLMAAAEVHQNLRQANRPDTKPQGKRKKLKMVK